MPTNTVQWKDFELSVELHKAYLDLAIKLNLFYYGATGAILSFHFSRDSPPISWLALILPIAFSLALGGFFLFGAELAQHLRMNIRRRAEELGLRVYPEGIVLVLICRIFGTIMIVVGLLLIGYLCVKP